MARVVWIDDDKVFLRNQEKRLKADGVSISLYSDIDEFFELLETNKRLLDDCRVIIVDRIFKQPCSYRDETDLRDYGLYEELRSTFNFTNPVILCTSYPMDYDSCKGDCDLVIEKSSEAYSWNEISMLIRKVKNGSLSR